MKLRIIKKNHAADPEIELLAKSISEPYDRATAMPPAWELKYKKLPFYRFASKLIREL